jgi:hypothetical protein
MNDTSPKYVELRFIVISIIVFNKPKIIIAPIRENVKGRTIFLLLLFLTRSTNSTAAAIQKPGKIGTI